MPESFYEADGERFASTELTRGPWDPEAQHAGPPAALLGREVERLEDAEEFQVARITFEILRAVPIAPLRVEARVVRPGRRVQLVEGSLSDREGEVMRATAWRLRTAPVELPELPQAEPPPGPEAAEPRDFVPTDQEVGYHTAMEYRFLEGAFREPGPAKVWMRMRHPLVGGEQTSPLQRVLTAADSGNGVSATLDWRRFLFINVDLSVHLERMPAGEWVCLDAVTLPQPNGVGVADTLLLDERGRIGRALQTLLVGERD
ncbi:MAG: thioesterase family protein [Actinomycetota bacterium]|nr:thioesterase family protein [Actinomycetota bacterium]